MDLVQNLFSEFGPEEIIGLEKITGMLWDRKVSKTIYSDPNESARLEYNTKKVASFIIVSQVLVYHIYQTHYSQVLPDSIIGLIKKMDFFSFFAAITSSIGTVQQVKHLNDIFKFELYLFVPNTQKSKEILVKVVENISEFEGNSVNVDLLGKIFHSLIPLEIRRKIAAFYSSNWSGRILASLSIHNPEDKVLDLTCGSGTLLVESYHVKAELQRQKQAS